MGKKLTHQQRWFVLIFTCVTIAIFVYYVASHKLSWTNEQLLVVVMDVGQGSSIYVRVPGGRELVFDAGPDMKSIQHMGTYRKVYDRFIDYALLSHGDLDHAAMLPYVLRYYEIATLAWYSPEGSAGLEETLKKVVDEQKIRTEQLVASRAIVLGPDTYIQILWPEAGYSSQNRNNTSLVAKLVHGETSFLFPGDIESRVERSLIEKYQGESELEADILVVAHHGSKSSSGYDFIQEVAPALAVIQAGVDNQYGHPHPKTLATFESLEVPVLNTAQVGDVVLVSDGQRIEYQTGN